MTAVETLEQLGIEPEQLDELVIDAALSLASNAKPEGLRGQVNFLKCMCGWTDEEVIKALIDQQPKNAIKTSGSAVAIGKGASAVNLSGTQGAVYGATGPVVQHFGTRKETKDD